MPTTSKDGRPTVEPTNIRLALRLVRKSHGTSPVVAFGPLALKSARGEMIRAGNCRGEINRRVGQIVRMFEWGVSEELVPPGIYEALRTVAGLRKGRSQVEEKPPIGPVAEADVEAVWDHVSRQVLAMIQLQRTTGMRPGEVVIMRPGDLDRDGDIWVYTPSRHKTEHHGKTRQVFIGPKCQEILRPWLEAGGGPYIFSPSEAMKERRELLRARRKSRVQPSQRDRSGEQPKKTPGVRYTVASDRKAIQADCSKVGVARWHSYQLRHPAATEIRKRSGIEASRVILGHEDLRATRIYAEADRDRSVEIMRQIG